MRPPCCDKSSVKRGLWTAEEDAKILAYISRHGTGNWTSVPKKAGLKRCGKSCRLRWTNYLRPDLKHDRFTTEEEELIVTLHATMGSRWSMIASQLPGRTDNDVKNYWNTKLRKKLRERGIDPVTHKPISQVFAHLGSIGLPQLSKTSQHYQSLKDNNRISCLNRDLRNGLMVKQETTTQTPPTSISNFSKMDPPPQDSLLANPAWDLLAQIQAIKLVAEASSYANQEYNQTRVQFFNENVPLIIDQQPSSFSSQPCETPENTESSFSWSEFLLEDPFLPPNQDNFQASSSSGSYQDSSHGPKFMGGEDGDLVMGMDENGLLQHQYSCDPVPPSPGYGAMCSERSGFYGACSENSFVDDLLESDSQLLWEFPELLDNPFLYSDGLL